MALDMQVALEWAAEFAQRTKLFEPHLNNRGYPIEGIKPPTAAEKVELIVQLAREAAKDQVPEVQEISSQIEFVASVLNLVNDAHGAVSADDPGNAKAILGALERCLSSYLTKLEGKD